MAIIRIEHKKNYTCISNKALRDRRLSFAAAGLHHHLLSYPDQWSISVSHLVKVAKEGRDKIKKLLRELECAGYLTREQTRGSKGEFRSTDFVIRETPIDPENPDPLTDSPLTENPSTENPLSVNTETYKVTNQSNTDIRNYSPLPPKGENPDGGTNADQPESQDQKPEPEPILKPPCVEPKNAEGYGNIPKDGIATNQRGAPVRVEKTASWRRELPTGLSNGSARPHQQARAQEVALGAFESKEQKDAYYRWLCKTKDEITAQHSQRRLMSGGVLTSDEDWLQQFLKTFVAGEQSKDLRSRQLLPRHWQSWQEIDRYIVLLKTEPLEALKQLRAKATELGLSDPDYFWDDIQSQVERDRRVS